jgi:hypothetical protein
MNKLFSTIASGLLLTSSLWAVPTLQLDIVGGTSDGDTTFSAGEIFTLQALALNPSGTYFISAAIVPKTPLATDFGSFTIGSTTFSSSQNMVFGVPPIDATANPHLGDHGIFNTAFAEISFTFPVPATVESYNTQTGELGPAGQLLNLQEFAVNTTGLGDGFAVHFDLYNTAARNGDVIRGDFAPFSHDAQSSVPDGGTTLTLLGSALACLGALRMRFA